MTKPVTVWMALSAQGHLAPFIGYAFRKKWLAEAYALQFGHSLREAGYRLVKVRVSL